MLPDPFPLCPEPGHGANLRRVELTSSAFPKALISIQLNLFYFASDFTAYRTHVL